MLARLVEDLRTLAHTESGTLTLHKEPIDLDELLRDFVSSPVVDGDGVTVRVETSPEVRTIDADPVRLREVLTNLVVNAVRHTPAGGTVTVDTRAVSGGIVMTVTDTGAGITAEDLPRAFDRFYTGAGSTGTGLGLAIAKGIVEAHGGTVRIASTVGSGTTVTIELPLHAEVD